MHGSFLQGTTSHSGSNRELSYDGIHYFADSCIYMGFCMNDNGGHGHGNRVRLRMPSFVFLYILQAPLYILFLGI
jgi:hypothetical protein